jgi:hypothetical protein
MSSRMPPRYLPTLTEVVYPRAVDSVIEVTPPVPEPDPRSQYVPDPDEPNTVFSPLPEAAAAPPDRQALAQQLIKLVQPQLEAELRSIAMELFEAQFSALLPSLHLHIEEAVRDALEQALPAQVERKL